MSDTENKEDNRLNDSCAGLMRTQNFGETINCKYEDQTESDSY